MLYVIVCLKRLIWIVLDALCHVASAQTRIFSCPAMAGSPTDEQLTLVKWRLEHGETSKGPDVPEELLLLCIIVYTFHMISCILYIEDFHVCRDRRMGTRALESWPTGLGCGKGVRHSCRIFMVAEP